MRADLAAEYGVDLAQLMAARRWRALIDLVTELPSTSRLMDALVNDEEYARAALSLHEDTGTRLATKSSIREESEILEALRGIYELIGAALGVKIRYPRPVTAIDRIRQESIEGTVADLVSELTPWAAPTPE